MPELKTIIDLLTEKGLRSKVTVMVGGAPVTKAYAREINADIYASTLFEAGEAAEELMKHRISRYAV
jgi:dimethylamine corrinoid protein